MSESPPDSDSDSAASAGPRQLAPQDPPPPEPEPPAPRPTPWVTLVLAAANIAVWIVTVAMGASVISPSAQWLFDHGGNLGAATLAGEEWRLFTSMFLHVGLLHIAMNMLGLITGGRVVERLFGPLGFAAIYLVSGLAGSLATALRPGVVSVGASGAIFGVLGALGAYYLLHRERMEMNVAKESRGLLVFIAYNLIFGLTQSGIDMYAHLGGLVGGFLCGLAIEVARTGPRLPRTAAVAAAGLIAVISAAYIVPPPTDEDHRAITAFLAAEREVVGRWNTVIIPDLQGGKLSDEEAAAAIERDIVPPWRAAREAFEQSGAGGPKRTEIIAYMSKRQEAWELLVQAVRANDDAKAELAKRRFQEAEELATKIGGD
jgi:rhomboid protease GluP